MPPRLGLKLVIAGKTVTVKSAALVAEPAELATPILPLVVPLGTVARIWFGESTLKFMELMPLNVTCVTPPNPFPVIVISVPTGPVDGAKELTEGGITTVKSLALTS
ncbi:hypothetical protein MJD09_03010, partial [bacterium]|nr:hypothetical protein [bacterium]